MWLFYSCISCISGTKWLFVTTLLVQRCKFYLLFEFVFCVFLHIMAGRENVGQMWFNFHAGFYQIVAEQSGLLVNRLSLRGAFHIWLRASLVEQLEQERWGKDAHQTKIHLHVVGQQTSILVAPTRGQRKNTLLPITIWQPPAEMRFSPAPRL